MLLDDVSNMLPMLNGCDDAYEEERARGADYKRTRCVEHFRSRRASREWAGNRNSQEREKGVGAALGQARSLGQLAFSKIVAWAKLQTRDPSRRVIERSCVSCSVRGQ